MNHRRTHISASAAAAPSSAINRFFCKEPEWRVKTADQWSNILTIRADAYEHSSPDFIIDVKIVLSDPAIRDLKMPSVCGLISDSDHDTRRLSCFEDDHDLIGLGPFEIWVDEFVATAPRRFYDRDLALCRSLRYPALELFSDVAQSMARHWV